MPLPILETARLTLRQPELSDADELVRICGDLEVSRWTTRVPHPYDRQDAVDRIQMLAGASEAGEEIMFLAVDRTDGHLVGLCGLSALDMEDQLEIGFLIGRQDWGKGYATEIATAVIGYGFETLGAAEIIAAALPENAGSIRLQEKLGFRHRGKWVKDAPARGAVFHLEVRALTRQEWSKKHDR